jgi:hypothetical protein
VCHAIKIMGSRMGVASFTRVIGRTAPTRRLPSVLNAAAGVVNDRLLAVNVLMLAVIGPRPEAIDNALLGRIVATGCCGLS